MQHRGTRLGRLFAAVLAVVAFGTAAQAQTYTFVQPSTGTAGNFSTPGNWLGGVSPPAGIVDTLQFVVLNSTVPNTTYTLTDDLSPGSYTINSALVFNNSSTLNVTTGSGTANIFTLALGANSFTMAANSSFVNSGPGKVETTTTGGGFILNGTTNVTGGGDGYINVVPVVSGSGGFAINMTGLGTFGLAGANTFTGGVTLTNGYLNLGNASALGAAANVLTVNGGTLRFTSAATIPNNILANAALQISNGNGGLSAASTPTLTGVISGAGGLTMSAFGTTSGAVLQGANTYTGATVLNPAIPASTNSGATLTLSGATGTISGTPSVFAGKNTTLTISNATGLNNTDRIPDAAPVTLAGSTINFNNSLAATETIGALNLQGLVRIGGFSTGVSTLTTGALTRTDNAIVWISSSYTNLPSTSGGTAPTSYPQIIFTGGLTGANAALAAGSGTGTEIAIVPWAAATTGNPRNLVTYSATNGLTVVPYTNTDYFVSVNSSADLLAATNKNVSINTIATYDLGGGSLTVNSIANQTSGSTFQNGTLTVYSGAITNYDPVTYGNNLTLAFGPRTGYIHGSWTMTFSGTSSITGSAGVVIGGTGQTITFSNTTGNPFTGGLFLNGVGSPVIFNADNQLGAAGGSIAFNGGLLTYNGTTNLTVNRPMTVGATNAVFSVTNSATTAMTLQGVISGAGAVIKEGTGILTLAGTNTYTGGTVVNVGTLQFTSNANLGAAAGKLTFNGGNLTSLAAAAVTFTRPVDFNSNATITTPVALNLNGTVQNVGVLYGVAVPVVTKAGAGTLALNGDASKLSGYILVTAGGLSLGGTTATTGGIPQVQNVTLSPSTTFTVSNAGAYNPDRLGDTASVILSGAGSVFSYVAPTTAPATTAERLGVLANTVAGGVFSLTGTAAGDTTFRLGLLNASAGLTIRGTGLGSATFGANTTHVFVDGLTTNVNILPNVFFLGTAGTTTSTTAAGYDTVRGIVQFTPPAVSGVSINNFAPDNVPLTAAYTINGAASTASTGASVYSLTFGVASTLTLNGGNAASATNGNTPDGTLALSGGLLSLAAGSGASTITSGSTTTLNFGASAGTVTTPNAGDSLLVDTNVTLAGTSSLTKAGAGTLTVNGPYTVTGATIVSAGTLAFPASTTVQNLSGAGTISVGGGNTLTANNSVASTFSGTVVANNLTKTGTGVLTLANTAVYTLAGGVTIGQGTLSIGSAQAATTVLANFTLGTGTTGGTLDLNGFSPTGDTTAIAVGTSSLANGITNTNATTASTLNLNLPSDTTLAVQFGGNLVVNKNDPNTLTLNGNAALAATTTGVFNVNNGTLVLAGTGNTGIGSGMSITVGTAGATPQAAIFRQSLPTSGGTGPFGTVTINPGSEWQQDGATYADPSVFGVVLNGGRINWTSTSIGTYLTFQSGGTGITTVASSIQSQIVSTNTSDLITGVAFNVNVAQGTVPSNGADLQIGIRQSVGLTKTGAGTLETVGNFGASTGTVTVSAGTLRASTSLGSGGVTVNGTGVLRGLGTLASAATVSSGGFIQGGDATSPTGTLSTSSSITIGNQGGLRAITGGGGTSLLSLTGTSSVLNLAPGTGNKFVINLVNDANNPLTLGSPYTINLASVATTGNIQLNGVSTTGVISASNYTLSGVPATGASLAVSGSNLQLTFTPATTPPPLVAYWSGAVSTVWNTGEFTGVTNWRTAISGGTDTGAVPDTVTDVFFATTTPPAPAGTTTLGRDFSINSLTFRSTAGAYTIGGANVLTISGGGVTLEAGTANQTLAVPVVLSGNQTWTNNSSNTLTVTAAATITGVATLTLAGTGNTVIAAPIQTGAGGLTKTGTGLLTLSGANTFTGAVGVQGSTAVTGLTLTGNGTAATAGSLTIGSGSGFRATVTLDNAGTNIPNRYTDTSAVSLNTGGLTLVGNAAGTAEALGALSVSGGTDNRVFVQSTTTTSSLTFASLSSVSGSNRLFFDGTNLGVAGAGNSRVFFTAAPALNASGNIPNAYLGTTASVTTRVGYNATLGVFATFTPTGTVVDNIGGPQLPTTLTQFTTTGTATANTGAKLGSLVLDGGLGLTLVQTYAATAGTGDLGGGNDNTPIDTLDLTGSGGLSTTATSAKTITTGLGFTGKVLVESGNVTTASDLTFASNVTLVTTGAFTKLGAGNLTLNSTPTIGGTTTVSAGTLTLNANLAASTAVTLSGGSIAGAGSILGTLTVSGTGGTWAGTVSVAGLTTVSAGVLNIGANAKLTAAGGLAVAGGTLTAADASAVLSLPAGATLTFGGSLADTFAGEVAGAGNLAVAAAATARLTLAGPATYAGTTTITSGILRSVNALSTPGGAVAIADGSRLEASGVVQRTLVASGSSGSSTGGAVLAVGNLTIADYAAPINFGGYIRTGAFNVQLTSNGPNLVRAVTLGDGAAFGSGTEVRIYNNLGGTSPGDTGVLATTGSSATLNGKVYGGTAFGQSAQIVGSGTLSVTGLLRGNFTFAGPSVVFVGGGANAPGFSPGFSGVLGTTTSPAAVGLTLSGNVAISANLSGSTATAGGNTSTHPVGWAVSGASGAPLGAYSSGVNSGNYYQYLASNASVTTVAGYNPSPSDAAAASQPRTTYGTIAVAAGTIFTIDNTANGLPTSSYGGALSVGDSFTLIRTDSGGLGSASRYFGRTVTDTNGDDHSVIENFSYAPGSITYGGTLDPTASFVKVGLPPLPANSHWAVEQTSSVLRLYVAADAVPEPAAAGLLAAAAVALGRRARRRAKAKAQA